MASLLVAVTALCADSAMAQVAPPSVQPGLIEKGIERSLPQQHGGNIDLPAPRDFATPSNAADIKFILRKIEIQGAPSIPADEIIATYKDVIGHEVQLADLYRVANAITAIYVKHGYALSFAVVPAQEIGSEGVAHIDVIEGYVADVQYVGDIAQLSDLIHDYGDAIKASRPLKTRDLERMLLLANDIPGLTVKSTFQRIEGGARGATRLVVSVEFHPYGLTAEIDNRGSKALGPWRLDVGGAINSPLGLGDQLRLRVLQTFETKELSYAAVHWAAPVDGLGATIALDVSYSHANPGLATLSLLNFASSGWIAGLSANYPLIRSREEDLMLHASINGKWLSSNLLSAPNSRDDIYAFAAGADYTARDDAGATSASLTLTQGFGGTTQTSPLRSRAFGSSIYSAAEMDVTRLQELGGGFQLSGAISAQLASRALLASEQCGYGGSLFGRGFDDNELVGDHCIQASAELRYAPWNTYPVSWVKGVQLYVFADAGALWISGTLLPLQAREQGAQSVGAGVRFALAEGFSGSLEFAQPLSRNVAQEGNRDGRIFFAISHDFFASDSTGN